MLFELLRVFLWGRLRRGSLYSADLSGALYIQKTYLPTSGTSNASLLTAQVSPFATEWLPSRVCLRNFILHLWAALKVTFPWKPLNVILVLFEMQRVKPSFISMLHLKVVFYRTTIAWISHWCDLNSELCESDPCKINEKQFCKWTKCSTPIHSSPIL